MNRRLEIMADRVLKENGPYTLKDGFLRETFESASLNERPNIVRKEYAKLIEIDEESLLVGDYPTFPFFPYVPFLENSEAESKGWEAFAEKYSPYENKIFMPGGNHLTANFDYVLKNGISGLIKKIEETQKTTKEPDKKVFLEKLCATARSAVEWVLAYGDVLSAAAEKERSKERRQELAAMANICRRIPYLPATSFREAIQSYYFVFVLFMPDGLGRIDQYLYPYYISDIENGKITRKEALDLTEELFIKMFCWLGKDEKRSGNHHGVVGGYTADGECGHNEYTSVILEAITEIPVWRPQISYRVTAKTTSEQLCEAIGAHCKRPDLIMFLNDDVIVNGLVGAGVAYEDAVGYSSSGCNETVLTGCSQPGALEGLINIMHSLEQLLKDSKKLKTINDFDEFYKAFEESLYKDLEIVFEYSFERDVLESQRSLFIRSLFTEGCITSATPITKGGSKYNFCSWCLTGLVNLADSLSIIRQTVFEEKRFTLLDVSEMLAANWKGFEAQRSYILNSGRYFGNDDDYVDLLINRVASSVNRFAENYTPYRKGRYLFGTLTGYELSHVVFGNNTGASLDGRYAGEPLCASITAYPGADKSGVTAYLKSAAKLSGDLIRSSTVVNLKLDKSFTESPEKRELLTALLQTYFRLGGIQLQINYLSADELIKAQAEPEKYRSLRVRITGFSDYFVSLDNDLQNEIILRTAHEL